MMSPSVLFVRSRAEGEDLAKALGCDVLGAHLAIAERTAIIERFGSEGYMILVATPACVTGWRGPKNMKVFFMDGFPQDQATRAQAKNRGQL